MKKKKLILKVLCICISFTTIIIPANSFAASQNLLTNNSITKDNITADDPGRERLQGDIPQEFGNQISPYQNRSVKYIHDDRFKNHTIKEGIDVSKYQGEINWNEVKNSGIDFAFIRIAYRGSSQGVLSIDPYAERNLKGASEAGIPIGVYIFSQAITPKEAQEEARFLLENTKNFNISLPYVMDFEYVGSSSGRLYDANLSRQEATNICRTFCDTINDAGFTPMIYANLSMLENNLYASQISKDYPIWLARYNSYAGYDGDYEFWQYSSTGTVNGISGNVDKNFWYTEKAELIKINNEYYYYQNGKFQEDYNGLLQYNENLYLIKQGKWAATYEGLYSTSDGNLNYIKNGIMQTTYNGLVKHKNGIWYYIKNGEAQLSYTGLAKHSTGTWYYVENGKAQLSYTGLAKHSTGTWYYVENGKAQLSYTGLAKHSTGTWYYIKNGKAQLGYTGLAKHSTGTWYYIKNGKWDKEYTGKVKYGSKYYFIKNGLKL